MSERVRFFYSFRSPYSYLVGPRVADLVRRYDIDLDCRGVPPMVTRGIKLSQAKKMYIVLDSKRLARKLGMPFGNTVDPLGEGAIRCLRVNELAKDKGRALEFFLAASRGIWGEGLDVATAPGLAQVVKNAGLEWPDAWLALEEPDYKRRIEENRELLAEVGHWGVPTFEVRGEVFWGQDRVEALTRKLEALGVPHR
ncbi:MAG: DsbA family protein [Myxococcales bacterium]|nr:DsbA family protein [Myxococcales bacterium]